MEQFVIIINVLWALEALYLVNSLRLFHHIIQFYSQNPLVLSVNIDLDSSLCYKGKLENGGRAIDFAARLIDFFFDQAVDRQFTLGKF